ncbi:uncharacterized protein LOC141651405 [Silene latifolia]|uniref:uncharacterized protein LOC141651405 n=1 Tax=Silene latifolia TaxID=37657 RepID=UPI003D770303
MKKKRFLEMEANSSVRFLQSACSDFLVQKSKAMWVDKGTSEKVLNISHRVVKMGKVCTDEHKQLLLSPVTNEEIKKAMFSIPNHKAAGPDGYSSAFFKDVWDIVGDAVCLAIKDFFQTGKRLKQLNHTLISLIPKCAMPQNVTQFRPISCCNVVYKCISKLLCARLAWVLPELISDSQGGFMKGRSIVENILICQDIVRLYNRKSVSSRFLMKVDLKKAYDSVSWEFLEEMLVSLEFPSHFISLIMECVKTASYSSVLNGDIFGFFNGKKGLRQGDPLSPILFTISMEYLSRVLGYVTENMGFKYHPMCGKIKLSHLMFADDLLLFSKGDVGSIMVLLRAFATFSRASGLHMSPPKTNAYLNGVPEGLRRIFCLPLEFMKDNSHLSILECLLQLAVLTSLYTYWMSIFVIPKRVLHRLNSICRNYLWDGSFDHLRVPPVSWAKICSPKKVGGLGLRDSFVWNVAAMGKLVWWIFFNPDKLWVKWISQIYLKGRSWTEYVPSGDISWGWRTMCRVRDKLSSGYTQGQWLLDAKGYTVKSGYELLRVKEALQVKTKLFGLGIAPDDDCLLCGGAAETHMHLFQQCPYSRLILLEMASLCHVALPFTDILRWIWLQKWSKHRRGVLLCAFIACFYFIWLQRNRARVEQSLVRPAEVVRLARNVTKMRICTFENQFDNYDRLWLESIDVCK